MLPMVKAAVVGSQLETRLRRTFLTIEWTAARQTRPALMLILAHRCAGAIRRHRDTANASKEIAMEIQSQDIEKQRHAAQGGPRPDETPKSPS